MKLNKVNIDDKFSLFNDYWSPKVVGELNGQMVKVVKVKGEFDWHHHDNEDELFWVNVGTLRILLRDGEITLKPGEFVIVPKGVEHKPVADEEVELILFEPATTLNTGNIHSQKTKTDLERI